MLFTDGSVTMEQYGARFYNNTDMLTYVQRLNVWPTATDRQVFGKQKYFEYSARIFAVVSRKRNIRTSYISTCD